MIELSDRLEAERRLAELLGHKNLRSREIPKYTRDFATAFYLAVQLGCWPAEDKLPNGEPVYVVRWIAQDKFYDRVIVNIPDHPNKAFAAMYAIVLAVTAKLKAKALKAADI